VCVCVCAALHLGHCVVLINTDLLLIVSSHLRGDSLAHLLMVANIHAHATSLVFETCNGLVTGAIAERLGGMYQSLKADVPQAIL
jgi:hypothetical protein